MPQDQVEREQKVSQHSQKVKQLVADAQKLSMQGNLDEAEELYQQILSLEPNFSAARLALAAIWQSRGRVQDAVMEARKAITECKYPTAQMLSTYGVILKDAGFLEEAKGTYQKALEMDPKLINPKINLAVLHMIAGDYEEAKKLLENLTEAHPEEVIPWLNLARIAIAQDDLDRAQECLNRVNDLNPKHPDLALLRALLAHIMRDSPSAIDHAFTVLEQNRGKSECWHILASNLRYCAAPLDRLEKILLRLVTDNVQNTTLLAIAVDICRQNMIWGPLPELERHLAALLSKPQGIPLSSSSCFTLLSSNVPQIAHKFAAESAWKRFYGCEPLPPRKLLPLSEISPLRVAFLSSDFRQHAVGTLIVGLLEKLPKDGRVTWYAYTNSFNDNSEIRNRIRPSFDRFINVTGLDDQDLAARIRKDRIDVLIDLNSITADTRVRVMGYRAAPIQMSWLGMPGTIGSGQCVDYMIGDVWTEIPDLADGFDEKFLQLPRSYQPNDHKHPDFSLAGSRGDHNLPEEVPILCCFNNRHKFSPETFDLWGRILSAVPDARLWITRPEWSEDKESVGLRDRLYKNLAAVGIKEDHVILGNIVAHAEHLARLSHADLMLDTLPYNMHTTCSDALRAGTPVLTLPGSTFAGRVAASILTTSHLQDWIAKDTDDYVQKAIAYASLQRQEMNAVKRRVFETYWASPMPDNVAFSKLLENIFLNLYERHAAGKPITHLRAHADGTLEEIGE